MNRTLARAALVLAALPVSVAVAATPASAASVNPVPPGWLHPDGGESSQGVGFCLSQIAQRPGETVGTSNAGEVARAAAQSGALHDLLAEIAYPMCGGPGADE